MEVIESILDIAVADWLEILQKNVLFNKNEYKIKRQPRPILTLAIFFKKGQVILSDDFGNIAHQESDKHGNFAYTVANKSSSKKVWFERRLQMSLFMVTSIRILRNQGVKSYQIRAQRIASFYQNGERRQEFIDFYAGKKVVEENNGVYELCVLEKIT